MKKATRIWLISAAVMILLGCLIFGGVMMKLQWDFTKLSTVKFETNRHEIAETYKNISVLGDTAHVVFLPSEDGKTLVVCHEQVNEKHAVFVEGESLTIEVVNTKKWYEYIGITMGNAKITVYLPEQDYGNLLIRQNTGDVEVPKDFHFQSMDITTNTGSVTNFASASGDVKIKTSTGNIRVENCSAQNLNCSVSTGKIIGSSLTCKRDLSVCVNTGKTALTDVSCNNLVSTGNTGDILLKNVLSAEKFSIQRTTGDVLFEDCDASEIFVETDTGDVEGTLRSAKIFLCKTDTGKVDHPQGVTGGRCEIITDTGNIKLSLSENS